MLFTTTNPAADMQVITWADPDAVPKPGDIASLARPALVYRQGVNFAAHYGYTVEALGRVRDAGDGTLRIDLVELLDDEGRYWSRGPFVGRGQPVSEVMRSLPS